MRGLIISIVVLVSAVIAFITGTNSADPTVSLAGMCLVIPALMAIGWNLNTALRSEVHLFGLSIRRDMPDERRGPSGRRTMIERGG